MQNLRPLNTNLTSLKEGSINFNQDRISLHDGVTTTGSYKLNGNIDDYAIIYIIMQYGTSNWISCRWYRSETLNVFPNVADSLNTPLFNCSYNLYIQGSDLNVGNLTTNTRILIRGLVSNK